MLVRSFAAADTGGSQPLSGTGRDPGRRHSMPSLSGSGEVEVGLLFAAVVARVKVVVVRKHMESLAHIGFVRNPGALQGVPSPRPSSALPGNGRR